MLFPLAVSCCLLALIAGQDGKAIAMAVLALCFLQLDHDHDDEDFTQA